jgi:uncharacterized protein (DUF1697 family)
VPLAFPKQTRSAMLVPMTVVISMLRGVNVAGHNQIKMEALRRLYESLGLRDPQTYIQSGNVVFGTNAKNIAPLAKQIEDAIERKFGFRHGVILRTTIELRDVIARNPFAKRSGLEAGKFLVTFLSMTPSSDVRDEILGVKTRGEEVLIDGREVYIYFPDGQGRSKVWPAIEKALKKSCTGRNWNTVNKLLEMAETLEGSR